MISTTEKIWLSYLKRLFSKAKKNSVVTITIDDMRDAFMYGFNSGYSQQVQAYKLEKVKAKRKAKYDKQQVENE